MEHLRLSLHLWPFQSMAVKGVCEMKLKGEPITSVDSRVGVTKVMVDGQECMDWKCEGAEPVDLTSLPSAHPLHYHHRLLKAVSKVPTLSFSEAKSSLVIEYEVGESAGVHRHLLERDAQIKAFHIFGSSPAECWLPHLKGAACPVELEFVVHLPDEHWFEKVRVISSGVMCQQFTRSEDDHVVMVCHYRVDQPVDPASLAWVVGIVERVPIPGIPFAYAFCPPGALARLQPSIDWLARAFNWPQWYLSSQSTQSRSFPHPAMYFVWLRDLPADFSLHAHNVSVLPSTLLHPASCFDAAFPARWALAQSLIAPWFVVPRMDWLKRAVFHWLALLLLRCFHGHNQHRLTLHALTAHAHAEHSGCRGVLLMHLLEQFIGDRQTMQRCLAMVWGDLTLNNLMRAVRRQTGKDVRVFVEQWAMLLQPVDEEVLQDLPPLPGLDLPLQVMQMRTGKGSLLPGLRISFSLNRKGNGLLLEITQLQSVSYHGTILVRVHEQDGVFDHAIHIDDHHHSVEVPVHSRARSGKRRRRRNGMDGDDLEEGNQPHHEDDEWLEDDLDSEPEELHHQQQQQQLHPSIKIDAEGEANEEVDQLRLLIKWVRVDPEQAWPLGSIDVLQPDWMWQNQLIEDRCIIGQLLAIPQVTDPGCLLRCLQGKRVYWPIRALAAQRLVELGAISPLLEYYRRRWCLPTLDNFLPTPNSFDSSPSLYLLRQAILHALGGTSDPAAIQCLVDQLYFNDNSVNQQSDVFLLATCIEALGRSLSSQSPSSAALGQIQRYIRLEQIHPYWGNLVLIKCLKSLRLLQQPIDSFWSSAAHAPAIRLAALTLGEFIELLPSISPYSSLCLQGMQVFFSQPCENLDALWETWQRLEDPLSKERMLRIMTGWLPTAEADQKKPQPAANQPIQLRLKMISKQHELSSGGEEAIQAEKDLPDWHAELAEDVGKMQIDNSSSGIKLRVKTAAAVSASDQDKLSELLQSLWDNYDSYAFRYPVDPSVPNYYQIVKEPMDLNTLRQRAHSSLTAFLLDLRKIFANCILFNQPDSLICDQARRLRKVAIKQAKKLFPADKQLVKSLLAIEEATAPVVSITAPVAVQLPEVEPQSEREMVTQILEKLLSHKFAYWFNAPIDPDAMGIPHYRDVIKEPMDLGTIYTRHTQEDYYAHAEDANRVDVSEFHRHVSLVFSNCRQFNNPNTLVYAQGLEMERVWERLWKQHFKSAISSSPVKIKLSVQQQKPWEATLLTILDQVMQHPWAPPFLEPVDPRLYPTYRRIVKTPIDLGTMKQRLLKHYYPNPDALRSDMDLMVRNCERFNGAGTDIVKAAEALLELFTNLYEELGL